MKKIAPALITVFLISVLFTGFSLVNSAHSEPKIMVVDTAAGLKMRKEPDQKADVLVVIPNGKSVQIIDEKSEEMTIGSRTGKWCKVEFDGYSEIEIICGEFEGSPQCRDNNGKIECYCTVLRYSGRNKKELQFGSQKEIFKVIKKDNVYQLYSKSGLEYELTWPAKDKGVIYINKEPYAIPGENFPVRKGKCGNY